MGHSIDTIIGNASACEPNEHREHREHREPHIYKSTLVCNVANVANIADLDNIVKLDYEFYKNIVFTRDDFISMITNYDSPNRIVCARKSKDSIADAFLIWRPMPTKGIYVTSWGGPKYMRKELLKKLILATAVFNVNGLMRIYTHAIAEWDTATLIECGFKYAGKGNLDDEDEGVIYVEDISELDVYELV